MENDGRFTIDHFGGVLEMAIKTGINSTTVRAGFRKCGLFPYDEDAIDYSRCLSRIPDTQTTSHSFTTPATLNVPQEKCDTSLESSMDPPLESNSSLLLPVLTSPPSSAYRIVATSSCVVEPPQILPISNASQLPTNSPLIPVPEDLNCFSYCSSIRYSSVLPFFSPIPHPLSPIPDSPPILHTVAPFNKSPNQDASLLAELTVHKPLLSMENVSSSSVQAPRSNGQSSRRDSITGFLHVPPTPKRQEIIRNYKQKRHFILTAAERLRELEQKEQEKENAAVRRQAAIQERATKKANIEKQKQDRKILNEQKRILKKAENEMKKKQRDKKKTEKIKSKDKNAATLKKIKRKTKSKKIRH